jgi:ubiquinone/menaquinone biosynthesis C-methylase UbiE
LKAAHLELEMFVGLVNSQISHRRTEVPYSGTEFYGARSEYQQSILDHAACALSRFYGTHQFHVLDILPGNGDYLIGLGQRLDPSSLTAFELLESTRDNILLKLRSFDMEGRVNFLLMDKISERWQIPVNDESFDCVTCFNRLNLVADPLALLAEIRRVLKTEAFLILTNINSLSLGEMNMVRNRLKQWRLLSPTQFASSPAKAISPGKMLSMLNRNGLKMVYFSGLGSPRAMYCRLVAQIFSQFGDMDGRLRYEYRQVSGFWEHSSFWSYLANVNFIIATKVK